jgi:hypothetical protein
LLTILQMGVFFTNRCPNSRAVRTKRSIAQQRPRILVNPTHGGVDQISDRDYLQPQSTIFSSV